MRRLKDMLKISSVGHGASLRLKRVSDRAPCVRERSRTRIVLGGLRGEYSIAELCRRESISQGLYYTWSKEFFEAGKKRLSGDTERQATSGEVVDLKREMRDLKEVVADLLLENRILKKSVTGDGEDIA